MMSNPHERSVAGGWSWMRVYYFEPRKDDLILDGVWPALHSSPPCGHSRQPYFQRDWLGGPNILIGQRTCCPQARPDRVRECVARYLVRNPSTSVFSEEKQRSISEALSRYENGGHDDGDGLRENNSIVSEPREPEGMLVRDPLIKEAYRSYLAESSKFCIRWLQEIRAGRLQRSRLAMHLLIAVVWSTDPEQLRAHVSLMSHAIGFFNGTDQGAKYHQKFMLHYESAAGEAVRALTWSEVEALTRGEETIPGMTEFTTLLRGCLDDFYYSIKNERYKPEPMSELLDRSPAWRSWQMTVSLVYRTLNQLGVTPLERFLSGFMVSRACEDLYGARALDLRDLIAQGREQAESILSHFSQYACAGAEQ